MRTVILKLLFFLTFGCNSTTNSINAEIKSEKFNKFIWSEELCEYVGTYDSTKVTYKQLENSYDLGFTLDRYRLQTKVFPNNINDINELSVDKLDKEYNKKKNDLESSDFINSDYWTNLKKHKLLEIEMEWKLYRLMILSYSNPDTLMSIDYPSECQNYLNGLVKGGDDLLQEWSKLIDKISERNAVPEKIKNDYFNKLNSSDKFKYAYIDVITFGWWNCVNGLIPRANNDDFHNEFAKNFIEIKEECDEP